MIFLPAKYLMRGFWGFVVFLRVAALSLVVFCCLWYAHGGGEPEQQNLPSHPPLQVEECALWHAFAEFLISIFFIILDKSLVGGLSELFVSKGKLDNGKWPSGSKIGNLVDDWKIICMMKENTLVTAQQGSPGCIGLLVNNQETTSWL